MKTKVTIGSVITLALVTIISGCASTTTYENRIRQNSTSGRIQEWKEQILKKTSQEQPWVEIGRHFAQFEDIDGARYDEENERLVIWGPKAEDNAVGGMPPLLLDDFAVALTVLKRGESPGVSIGTVSGRVPTESDIKRVMSTRRLPVEYIPPSTRGTHMGAVLFEVDRSLKGLAHGEDNLTGRPVSSSVPGYVPVTRLLRKDNTLEENRARPLGLWWFIPDEPGVAIEGYTMRFVSYKMRVDYRALMDDPAVEVFGKHLSDHFEEYAKEFVAFRELVRIHKLVQVARWYEESGFPMERFFNEYKRLDVYTPSETQMRPTIVSQETTPGPYAGSYYIRQQLLIGGVDLSPRNYYVPAPSIPSASLTPGTITHWQPNERDSLPSVSPVRYGTVAGHAPVPAFAMPVFQARPATTAFGWTATVGGKRFAVVSIPMGDSAIRQSSD